MIAGLILAAGESSRMGTDKALLSYRGRTFLESILASLREAGVERVAVVLGHHADEIRKAINLRDADVVVNREYRQGQTSSLQAGLRSLATGKGDEIAGVVLCLVDHPVASADTIRALVSSFQASGQLVTIPTHQGQRGHPVLIARALFDDLLGLAPDQGANTVIRQHRDATEFVAVDDPGILTDIDDSESYRSLRAAAEGRVLRPASKRKNR